MRRTLATVAFFLAVPLVIGRDVTRAQTTIDPASFASPVRTMVGAGATLISSGIETNDQAAVDVLFLRFGGTTAATLTQQGRVIGYGAHVQFPSGSASGITIVYYASIFGTPDEAKAAFAAQHVGWVKAGGTEAPVSGLGDPGLIDAFSAGSTLDNGTKSVMNELFFVRGSILLETYLVLSRHDFNAESDSALNIEVTVAGMLDTIAQQQESPPATSTPPASALNTPTAVPTAHATHPKCKKGMVLRHGKCVKRKHHH